MSIQTLASGAPHRATSADAVPGARPALVLIGGVPGAGKSTLLRHLTSQRAGLRAVDPETLHDRIASWLPARVPYRWYRPVVHTVSAVRTLLAVLRGPTRAAAPLVLHDPATRPRRRQVVGRLARWRGWEPALLMLDVSREVALTGQVQRRRVVRHRSFNRHWARWQQQRPGLTTAYQRGDADGPWSRVYVLDREQAAQVLPALLGGAEARWQADSPP